MASQTNQSKRILLIVLIIILISIEAIFLLAGIFSILTDEENELVQTATTFLFTMGLFGFVLWWAFRTLNALKTQRPIAPGDTIKTPNDTISLQVKIELPEYRRLMFTLTYRKPVIVFVHFMAGSLVILAVLQARYDWFVFVFVALLLYIPLSVYLATASNYKASKALHEPILFEINPDGITSRGATFNSTIDWKLLHTTKELKDWFLLYTSKQVAVLIPKRAFASEHEMQVLREWCKNVR
jgi:hypothetical protein